MKNKKLIALLILVIICLAGGFFYRDFFSTRTGGDYRNITNMESAYNADGEIAQALERMKNNREKAAIIARSNTSQRVIALTFDGLGDRTVVQQILDLLETHHAKATFFVDGVQTAEDPKTVLNITAAGQKIENYTLSGMGKMENLPVERLVKDFSRAQKIIKVTTDQGPNLLKCYDTKYTDQLLQVAKACGFNSVVKSDAIVNVKQLKTQKAAEEFVRGLKPGSIVSVKLKTNVEPIVNEPGKTDLRPAIDKQPGLKELSQPTEPGDKEIVEAVEKLLIALQSARYTTAYVEDFSKSKPPVTTSGNLSLLAKTASLIWDEFKAVFACRTAYAAERGDSGNEIKSIWTTEPAVAYSFGGLSNEAVVSEVLGRLNSLGIKATFFVADTEMRRYPKTVRKIIANGHEIGLAIRPKDGESFEETRQSILSSRKLLRDQFGVTTDLVKQPWGAISDSTKEAVASLNCKLIGQSINVVQSKHKDADSSDQIISEVFGKYRTSLSRGEIVYFRMDFYTHSRLVVELMEKIKQQKVDNVAYATSFDNPASNWGNDSQYMIKPVGTILNNTPFLYQFPVDPAGLKPESPSKIGERDFLAEASKRYIGNGDVTYEDRLLGFSKMEVRRLDQTGLIQTQEKVIFLTFDDWGTDASINKLLYVLRKHNAQGSFFIITNNVLYNPSLLRSIAVQGHDIGSHSDKHIPMVIRHPQTGKQVGTQEKEAYVKDLATAYQKLRQVTGDVTVNGKPALTRFFRPPQLAVSKMGVEALFETGYEYIVGGSCSTYDYDAKSVTQLVRRMEEGIYSNNGEVKKGAILVMHMSDSCPYTAVALDILLTANEAKPDSDPSKFKVGRLSDYLTAGYSQMSRRK